MKRLVFALACVPVLIAGCGLTDDDGETAPAATTVLVTAGPDAADATTAPLMPKSDVYVDTANSQADGGFVGAISDVTSRDCAGEGGTWDGWGTLQNTSADVADYRVWVAFIDAAGATVGLVESDLDGVDPGATGEFSASMPYSGADTLSCVLRVERRAS